MSFEHAGLGLGSLRPLVGTGGFLNLESRVGTANT